MKRGLAAAVIALIVSTNVSATDPDDLIDLGLDLPIEPPAALNSQIAALFTQSNVHYRTTARNDDPTTPPVTPDDPNDDPRDEPPPVFFGEEIDSESDSIFYVLDYSGSMGGSRIKMLKEEFTRSVAGLSPNFKFNVLMYGCSNIVWSRQMEQALPERKHSAITLVRRLDPWGGTGTGMAVAQALMMCPFNMSIVLITDGGPNCGKDIPEHLTIIRNANHQGASINVFGIDASGDYRAFCMDIASQNNGSYFDLTTPPIGNNRK